MSSAAVTTVGGLTIKAGSWAQRNWKSIAALVGGLGGGAVLGQFIGTQTAPPKIGNTALPGGTILVQGGQTGGAAPVDPISGLMGSIGNMLPMLMMMMMFIPMISKIGQTNKD
jgi:hypothetical protein